MRAPTFRLQLGAKGHASLGALLEQHGLADALEEGRVFVGGERAQDGRVGPGALVEVYAARQLGHCPVVLGRKDGVVAVYKPEGLASEPDHAGNQSVQSWLAASLQLPLESLHASSRLDVPVSGVMLVTTEREATKALEAAQSEQRLRKRYLALAAGRPRATQGEITAKVAGKVAHTRYGILGTCESEQGPVSLLLFEPNTGRTHQLRKHAAFIGSPLLGDARYGGPRRLIWPGGLVTELARVFLHALSVELLGEGGLAAWAAYAPVPEAFVELWSGLGGATSDFEAKAGLDDAGGSRVARQAALPLASRNQR